VSFLAGEPCRYKGADDLERELNANHTRAETKHIAVVMFA